MGKFCLMMSDEFIAVATKEVSEDIVSFENLLKSCYDDSDIVQNSAKLQKYTHKIKGLAPMMGKEDLGNFSSSLDDLLKKMIEGISFEGIFPLMSEFVIAMKKSINEPDFDFGPINDKIQQF